MNGYSNNTDIKVNESVKGLLERIDDGRALSVGHNSTDIRLQRITGETAYVIHSTRMTVSNAGFFVNSIGIPVNGLNITFPVAATLLGIASASALDTAVGDGARTVLINGLDTNWDAQSEVITLNGQTKVNSTKLFMRINELTVLTVGVASSNQGNIYVSDSVETFVSGLPTVLVFGTIGQNYNLGTNGVFSTPRNTLTCATHLKVSTDATEAKPLLMRATTRPFGLPVLRIADLVFSSGSSNFPNDGFKAVQGKTDIVISSNSATATTVDRSVIWWSFASKVQEQGQ